jgi:1,4-alpha-glucan branching enzyme
MHKQNKNQKSQANVDQSATATRIEVVFALEHLDAKEVYLCGDFNQWSPVSLRMLQRNGDGHWEKRVTLPPGRYEYKFIVDGKWLHDAKQCAPSVRSGIQKFR